MRRRKQHGGRREGAGRKPKSDVARTMPIPVKVTPAELDQLRGFAAWRNKTLADFVRGELGLSSESNTSTPAENE